MVSVLRGRTRGAGKLGCLFSLLIAVVIAYYGVGLGRVYLKYYQLKDEMETSARFARGQSDEAIVRHLAGIVRDLDLPAEAGKFIVKRTEFPPFVTIRTQYRVTLELPFHNRVVTLKPNVAVRQ